MYASTSHRLTLLLLLALLVGCGTPSTGIAPSTTTPRPHAETATLTNAVKHTSTTTPVATQTPEATTIVEAPALPAGWHHVAWQGFSVPLPPEAKGIIPSTITASDQTHNVPVLAAGILDFPPPPTLTGGAIGEYPSPPSLTLLQSSGTLEEWIALEEKAIAGAEGGVMEPVESLTIAGREARHYQRTVPGFNYNDYYVLKPTATTLLVIYTDKAAYGPLVDGLTFAAP